MHFNIWVIAILRFPLFFSVIITFKRRQFPALLTSIMFYAIQCFQYMTFIPVSHSTTIIIRYNEHQPPTTSIEYLYIEHVIIRSKNENRINLGPTYCSLFSAKLNNFNCARNFPFWLHKLCACMLCICVDNLFNNSY